MSTTASTGYFFKSVSTVSSSALPGIAGVTVFDVTGACKVLALYGFVTGSIENVAVNISCSFQPSRSGVDPQALAAGNAAGNATAPFFFHFINGGNPVQSRSVQMANEGLHNVFMTSGRINFCSTVAASGSMKFHLLYLPLADNTVITPRF